MEVDGGGGWRVDDGCCCCCSSSSSPPITSSSSTGASVRTSLVNWMTSERLSCMFLYSSLSGSSKRSCSTCVRGC